MYSNCEICITAQRAITERVALLYSGILPFGNWRFRPATWLVDIETLSYIQISIVTNVFDPWNMQEILANIVKLILSARQLILPYSGLERRIAKFPIYSNATCSIVAYELLYIFSGLNPSTFTLICMWNNVSTPTSHVANQTHYFVL